MDDTALRGLAEQLMTELPTEIPDPLERAPVADAIGTALGAADRRLLLDALSSHPSTARWMLAHSSDPSAHSLVQAEPEFHGRDQVEPRAS